MNVKMYSHLYHRLNVFFGLRFFVIFSVFLCQLSHAQYLESNLEAGNPTALGLIKKAQNHGLVRVIVRPKTLAPFSSMKEGRVHHALMLKRHLGEQGLTLQSQVQSQGLLVYEVTENQLVMLLSLYDIDRVDEDRLSEAHLLQSIPFISADRAHQLEYEGQNVAIAIIDSGVDKTHPAFSGRVVEEACFSSKSSVASTLCPFGFRVEWGEDTGIDCSRTGFETCDHGTHVAAIAGGDNGVAPQAKIIAIQVFSLITSDEICRGEESCVRSYASDQMNALEWLLHYSETQNLAAVNMSLGGGKYNDFCDEDLRKPLIDELLDNNIVTVISSGNNAFIDGVGAPGCVSSAVTVGSTPDDRDEISWFSNTAAMVDLLAPGDNIVAAIPGGETKSLSGTSMAAPHVTGAIAVMKSLKPSENVHHIESILKQTGVSVVDEFNDLTFSRIDVLSAVNTLLEEAEPVQ